MQKTLLVSLCPFLVLGAVVPALPPVPFRHVIIDSGYTGFGGDCKGVGDIDGEGFLDVIGSPNDQQLAWYRYPDWKKTVIARANVEFTTDCQVRDVNGDGAPDIIIPDGNGPNNVLWFENPRGHGGNPATDPWTRHVIGTHGTSAHDLEVGDINGDGKLDVVTRKGAFTRVWLQNTADSWTMVDLSSIAPGEGVALAPIARSGRLDLVVTGHWIETPADPVNGTWVVHTIDTNWPDRVGIAVGDINKDGRVDVLFAPSESAGRLSWYEAPADPRTGTWIEHVVDNSVDFVHTFKTADMNNDGQLDVVFAEMAQSSSKRVGFYLNEGNGTAWTLQIVATSGSHNIRVADIGRDGDMDIIGANWQSPPLEMWENMLADTGNPADYALSSPTGSQNVTAGQSATYTITVTAQNGTFPGAVTLGCLSPPPRSSCTLNPASVTPGSGSAGSTLTIFTTANSSASAVPASGGGSRPPVTPWLVLLSVALAAAALAAHALKRRPAVYFPLVLLLVLLAFQMLGCGVSSNTPPPPPQGTPPDTYTITVTGTSGSVQHTTTVTLVVH